LHAWRCLETGILVLLPFGKHGGNLVLLRRLGAHAVGDLVGIIAVVLDLIEPDVLELLRSCGVPEHKHAGLDASIRFEDTGGQRDHGQHFEVVNQLLAKLFMRFG